MSHNDKINSASFNAERVNFQGRLFFLFVNIYMGENARWTRAESAETLLT